MKTMCWIWCQRKAISTQRSISLCLLLTVKKLRFWNYSKMTWKTSFSECLSSLKLKMIIKNWTKLRWKLWSINVKLKRFKRMEKKPKWNIILKCAFTTTKCFNVKFARNRKFQKKIKTRMMCQTFVKNVNREQSIFFLKNREI